MSNMSVRRARFVSLTSLSGALRGNNMSDSEDPHCANRKRPWHLSAPCIKLLLESFFKHVREKCIFYYHTKPFLLSYKMTFGIIILIAYFI